MTRDEIIEMAREAASPDTVDPHCDGWWTLMQEELERFFRAAYAVGAAAEREACAKVCDFEVARLHAIDEPRPALAAGICAAAIRARSEK